MVRNPKRQCEQGQRCSYSPSCGPKMFGRPWKCAEAWIQPVSLHEHIYLLLTMSLVSHFYQPNSSGKFRCLDGSMIIPYTSLDDDYCDCPDGSDEPGTAACEGVGEGWFWCANEGHIPGKVKRSRVNDGLCGELHHPRRS